MRFVRFTPSLALALALAAGAVFVRADGTPQPLPFAQDWTDTGADHRQRRLDRRARHPGLPRPGHHDATGVDPQTLLGTSADANDLDVDRQPDEHRTRSRPAASPSSRLANPTIALKGSGTADAPYILLALGTTGQSDIRVGYTLRDLDGSADNAVQPVALQYRVGSTGPFTNVPAGFVADATTGPSLAGARDAGQRRPAGGGRRSAAAAGPHHHRQRRRQRRVGRRRRHHGDGRRRPAAAVAVGDRRQRHRGRHRRRQPRTCWSG